jgi:hypothetical protein
VFSGLLELLKFAKRYPFSTDHHSCPNNDAGQGAYLSSAPNNPAVNFPIYNSLKTKAGANCKPSGNSMDGLVIEVNNGAAACLPGSTSLKAKAEQIRKHSHNSSDRSGVDVQNGPAACLVGSTSTIVKAVRNSKNLGKSSDRSVIDVQNGPAACLPGSTVDVQNSPAACLAVSTSTIVKAVRNSKNLGKSSDRSVIDVQNGPAACLPGSTVDVQNSPAGCLPECSTSTKVIGGWNSKNLGNWSDRSVIDVKNGSAAWLPGSASSRAKAGWNYKVLGPTTLTPHFKYRYSSY